MLLMMFNSTDLKNQNNTLYERRDGDMVRAVVRRRAISAPRSATCIPGRRARAIPMRLSECRSSSASAMASCSSPTPAGTRTSSRIGSLQPTSCGPPICSASLSDQQFQDAFRAGGYDPDVAARFIARLREKIEQGKSVGAQSAARN